MRWLLLSIAALLGAVSLALTVRLCSELESGWLPVAIGVGLECGKYALGAAGARELAQGRWRGAVALAVSAVLAGGSVAASVAWMRHAEARAGAQARLLEDESLAKSQEYTDWRAALSALDTQLQHIEQARAVYLAHDQATKAVTLQPEADRLTQARAELLARKPDSRSAQDNSRNNIDFWDALGGPEMRGRAYLAVAVLLELVALLCLGLGSQSAPTPLRQSSDSAATPFVATATPAVADPRTVSRETVHDAPQDAPDAPGPRTAPVPVHLPSGTDDTLSRVRTALLSGALPPTHRALRSLGLGQDSVKRILDQLVAEGVLARDGRGYRAAQTRQPGQEIAV